MLRRRHVVANAQQVRSVRLKVGIAILGNARITTLVVLVVILGVTNEGSW